MGYIRAEEILPIEVIELIQQYVDGENIMQSPEERMQNLKHISIWEQSYQIFAEVLPLACQRILSSRYYKVLPRKTEIY